MAVGGGYSGSATVALPNHGGTYYLIYSANDNGALYETNMSNNLLVSAPVTLTYLVADLAPVSVAPATNNVVSYPASPQAPTAAGQFDSDKSRDSRGGGRMG